MPNEVVLDIETQNTFQDAGELRHKGLKISVIGCYFYETDEYRCFELNELPALYKRLEHSGRIIGYNTIGFDYPVMNNYYAGDFCTFPSLDLMLKIQEQLGFRLKLDDVAKATLGISKSGHGLQAVQWWKEGKIQEIKDYCLQDVKVTREVYEFGKRDGYVKYYDRLGKEHQIPVDFSEKKTVEPTINFTMGF